jgi:Sulfatase
MPRGLIGGGERYFVRVSEPTPGSKKLRNRALVISGLFTAGVAAPILDLYGRNPSVFVANRSTPLQIALFAVLITFTLPLVGFALLYAAQRTGERAFDMTFIVLLAISALATGMAISRQVVPDNTVGAIALGVGVATLVIVLYRRIEPGLRYFSVLGPVVLIMFLVVSPSSRLLASAESAEPTAPSNIGSPAPIVFIQLDELPLASLMTEDGTINRDLFPNFARLADTGNWYRNALSNSPSTTTSVPAILSGRLGDPKASPSLIDHPDNLFTLLGSGYEMHVVEWLTDMCPEELCKDYAARGPARFASLLEDVGIVYGHLSLPEAMRASLPSIDGEWKGFLGQADTQSSAPVDVGDLAVPKAGVRSRWIDWFQRILDGVAADAPPTLHFVHLEAPHIPWRINPSGSHYQRPEEYDEVDGVQNGGNWVDRPELPRLGYQRQLYQLGFVDERLGVLFDRLQAAGIWDDAMVIVLSDHGESFVPGQHRRWPTDSNLSDLYRIPLLVKLPHQAQGEVFDDPVFAIDVLPTVADVLDIDTDFQFDGMSLLDTVGTDRPHQPIFYCCNGAAASTDIDDLFAQVERNHEWVPNQDSWIGVAGSGDLADLVGSQVADLAPVTVESLKWSLTPASRLEDVDRSTGFVQTFISGRLELPDDAAGDDLLVSVNGVVAGTGVVTRDEATGGEIHALIAEDLVDEGHNDVAILVPGADGTWMTGIAADIDIEYVADDGHTLELMPEGAVRVEISAVDPTGDGWEIAGWAADVVEKRTPDRVYVFASDQLVAFGPPNKDLPDVPRWFESDKLLRSGFVFDVPRSAVPAGVQELTVIAEFGGKSVQSPATLPD